MAERTDGADPTAATDTSGWQIPFEDSLEPHVTDDIVDEGFSPPDRAPAVDIPTPAEERAGEGLARRLRQEEPEIDSGDDTPAIDGAGIAGPRSGRLVADQRDGEEDDDVLADDAGIAGGAASGEEAAMHIVEG